ncbi:MAG: tRNA lysidine(34) synthetase TilS [Bacteroidales bacterium]|jgi:tRNA(Ile)-lysidine synthase
MKEEFENYLRDKRLAESASKILLAVSGGIDSMVMTHLFISIGASIGIAHCNFNLRGAESDGDEEFVKQFASEHNIPFHSVGFDTSGFAAEKGISIQMAARELRYRWFEEIRQEHNYDKIALAHNMNDNVETFLINLTRGTGLAGLTGMKPLHQKLIRPILFATRNSILDYSRLNNIIYREDRTNADTKYVRNKIRHSVIPLFREINPSFDTTIAETAERLGEISEIVNAFIAPVREKLFMQRGKMLVFRIKELPSTSYRRTLLFELFRPFGIGTGQLDDLEKLTDGRTGSQLFTGNWRLIKNRNEIIAAPREKGSGNYYEISSIEDFSAIPWVVSAELSRIPIDFVIPASEKIACLDAEKTGWPLIIRNHAAGDYFYPLGMRSKKKLSDYFIDKKYSIPEKEKMLVMESAGQIVWLIGDRIDNRYRITDSTRTVLTIKIKD